MKNQPLYTSFTLSITLLFSSAIQAGDGALAITTDPLDTEIYVNGELKVNATPVVFKLPVGKHRIDVKKDGKQPQTLEILLAEDTVISKKIVLLDVVPQPTERLNFSALRDSFETEAEFQDRQRQLKENLGDWVKRFNQAVQEHNPSYQAGVAKLQKDQYNLLSGVFPVQVEWQTWVTEFNRPKNLVLVVPREEAKALWLEGSQKPVYVYLQANPTATIYSAVLMGLGKEWLIRSFGRVVSGVKCLEVAGDLYQTGTPVRMGSCYDYPPQQWRWDANDRIVSRGSKCLTAVSAGVQLEECQDQLNQQWQFDEQNRLVNGEGRCLGVDAVVTKPADGTLVGVSNCHGGLLQQWHFYEW